MCVDVGMYSHEIKKRERGSEKKKLLWLVMNGTRFLSVYIYINVYTYIYIYIYASAL